MTAGQSAAGRDVESINEEAVLRAVIDAWPTDSDHVSEWHPDDAALYRLGRGRSFSERFDAVTLQRQRRVAAAVLPLLRLSDVPGLERQLRDKIAGEIEAKRDADRSWRAFNFAERVNDTALLIAAQIARGSSS